MQINVASKIPEPIAGSIAAWIDLGGSKGLAAKATVQGHPGWADIERRAAGAPLSKAYLSASSAQLYALPVSSQKYGPTPEKIKSLAAAALAKARARGADSLVYYLDAAKGGDYAADVAEGIALADYNFDKYQSNGGDDEKTGPSITFVVPSSVRAKVKRAVDARLALADSVNRARDLVNEPGSVATPAELEARALAVAEAGGLEMYVLDAKQLRKEGYEGLLKVGRGGEVPPRMIVMRYHPSRAKAAPHLGLLGKGITFDTGGISMKPPAKMWEMKGDMAGAAAVIYAMEAIARAKPKIRVTAIIVTAQNYVDSKAILPGDIMRGRNGKTVHIDNTDAEGRLVLTDGLWRAGEEEITHLVDVATLTGAIVRALGTSMSGAFGNDRFADQVTKVANDTGEACWRLPLVDEYKDLLKNDVADLNNIGGPNAGSITAALFLREFLPDGISWTHLDIAGTFLNSKRAKYMGPGATGVMVRTFANLAERMAKKA